MEIRSRMFWRIGLMSSSNCRTTGEASLLASTKRERCKIRVLYSVMAALMEASVIPILAGTVIYCWKAVYR